MMQGSAAEILGCAEWPALAMLVLGMRAQRVLIIAGLTGS